MAFSRSPSPTPDGGWSSPGLDHFNSGHSTPVSTEAATASAQWLSSKIRNAGTGLHAGGGYPSFSTLNKGFFTRHMRRLSSSLPSLNPAPTLSSPPKRGALSRSGSGTEREKRLEARTRKWSHSQKPRTGCLGALVGRWSRKARLRLLVALSVIFCIWWFFSAPLSYYWNRPRWLGGGEKFVIILAANVGGGVMEWKGAREWAIERDSVRNKRKYAARWGYDLEIVDMSTKKRYAHEWRESWEKVDFIRTCLRKYPRAEWFWWLDLNTYIMEPSYSLQSHIFDRLDKNVYRDINEYNPLNISHPPTALYLDGESRSATGDGRADSINLVLSQDCSGFNLGSFFLRRSAWTDRLLDVWWDPVSYEQKHMEWEHKEQDALEQLYQTQAWIRKHSAFLPQRMINSFPQKACDEHGDDSRIHYDRRDRDFLVNMAGCEWGRDCWGEMYNFRELSYYLNRNPWERIKEDLVAKAWYQLTGQKVRL